MMIIMKEMDNNSRQAGLALQHLKYKCGNSFDSLLAHIAISIGHDRKHAACCHVLCL